MNLTNFLRQIDALTAQYSATQLRLFIHDFGRVLPEYQREDFLKRLEEMREGTKVLSHNETGGKFEFEETYRRVRTELKRIESGEVAVSASVNMDYDEWYEDEEELYYEDDEGISDILEEACGFVHVCMDVGRYKEAIEIGKRIIHVEIPCFGEYGDETLKIEDMADCGLLQYDLKRFLLDTLYCTCFAMPLEKRSEALYEILANIGRCEVTLESVMQHGDEEPPDFCDFLPHWIEYLGDRAEETADRFIGEAVRLLDDVPQEIGYAGKFAAIHPGLYLDILEDKRSVGIDELISIGMEAMNRIPSEYLMRSRVALKTAEYVAEAGGEASLLKKCCFAAYESDTSAINYLRALLNGYDTEEGRGELRRGFTKFSAGGGNSFYCGFERYDLLERSVNHPGKNMFLLLCFLDGQFVDVLDKGLNQSRALGWSGTFMKQGIALFLLYLYEGSWDREGIATMVGAVKMAMNFSAEEYEKGTYGLDYVDENDLFRQLFLKWKSIVRIETDVRDRVIKKITKLLEKRTEGIMDANRRNYYGECAAYIAALGETQESLGEPGAKQRLMTSYHKKYVRRYAFRAELRNYGWMDAKG